MECASAEKIPQLRRGELESFSFKHLKEDAVRP
jgi:hypothetical protein